MVVLMKRIIEIVTVVLMLGMSGTARATGQIPDLLIVGNDTILLFCNPLEGYFDAAHPRPDDMYGMGSTACWRAYQATFELRQDSLFLTAIKIGRRGDSSDFYPLEKLFGYQTGTDGVFAYWVNDTLTCVAGECLYYIHMGYASIFEFDINYIVRHGLVKEKQVFDNRKTFLPYSDEHGGLSARLLQTFVEQQIDYSDLDSGDRHTYVQVLVKEVDGDGRIKKVEINGESRRQERAVRQALEKVPRFNVLYSGGKQIDGLEWEMTPVIYASEEERALQGPTRGPDIGEYEKGKILEGDDVTWRMKFLIGQYLDTYHDWMDYIADTTAMERQYKDYFCQLFGDSLLYQHHYFTTLGDSALKYYYQYWDMTGDHEKLYPEIVALEQELGRPHNPKIVQEKNPEFVLFVQPEELTPSQQADKEDLVYRCRQVSYHLRGFGEGDLHEPLPQGIREEWRLLMLRGSYRDNTSPVLVKVTFDGAEARIAWRVAKEDRYKTYPGLELFRHGIRSEGERRLTAEEWKRLQDLADAAGIDTMHLENDYFTSPPAIYHVEHRTAEAYHVVNDYNHPYYTHQPINPLFWTYRAFCKFLIELADPTLPFDIDDERYNPE